MTNLNGAPERGKTGIGKSGFYNNKNNRSGIHSGIKKPPSEAKSAHKSSFHTDDDIKTPNERQGGDNVPRDSFSANMNDNNFTQNAVSFSKNFNE